MTGRRQEDIAYFTGARVRPGALESMKVNPLLTKVSDKDKNKMKNDDALIDVMANIYTLIKNNSEEQKRQLEIDKNLNIDKEKQREKWHSDLINALTGIGGKKSTATPVKKEGGGMFEFLKSMIEDAVKGIQEVINNLKTLVGPVVDFFNSIRKFVGPLLDFLGSNLFALLTSSAGILAVTTIGSLAALLFLAKSEKDKIEANPNAPEYKDNPYAMSLRGEAKNIGQATAQNQRKAIKQIPRKQVEDFVNSDFSDKELQQELGGDRKTLKQWLISNPKPSAMYQAPVAAIAGQPNTAVPASSVPETSNTPTPPTKSAMPVSATPMPPAPADTGSRVQSAISQNIEMNLDQDTSKIVTIDNSKTVNASGGASAPAISMDSSVTVRTDDPTLQNILKKITRQV
jgi:hypothetical protein